MHQVEGVINFIKAHGMRDKRFQIDITGDAANLLI
ncbi:hypothetical protein FORC82_3691 [Escherichia coli]|nr:hypothetical protein FORC82_3691 [Escherichia coli]